MKEQEAIERIAKALENNPNLSDTPVDYLHEAGVAWNEMKAIAREDAQPIDSVKQWISPHAYNTIYDPPA